MRVTKITKVDPTHYAVETDTFMSDGSYLSDSWMHVVDGVLRAHEDRSLVRLGPAPRVRLTADQQARLEALPVGGVLTATAGG